MIIEFQSSLFEIISIIIITMIRKIALAILTLCLADSATTWAVVSGKIGYEANSAIAGFVGYPLFHAVKLVATLMVLYGIHAVTRENRKLELVSYLTILIFYALVVANNLCVYVLKSGFGLSLPKLFVIFSTVFCLTYLAAFRVSADVN